jgi:RimJ/RimL family protein N-acetyltransferase
MLGRTVTLEPLDAARHAAALWQSVQGHDQVWQWLFDGPYANEDDFTAAIARKQASTDQIFYAIIPVSSPKQEEAASLKDVLGRAARRAIEALPQQEEAASLKGHDFSRAEGASDSIRPSGPEGSSGQATALGYASYLRMEPAHGVIEVGNILLSPALQRTTAATEAMYLMARHVFDDLGYRRYEWKCNALNNPSRRAAQRLGFTFEGIFRQHMVIKGCNRDTAWFSMLDHEWPARKHAFEAWLDPSNFDAAGRQRRPLTAIRP